MVGSNDVFVKLNYKTIGEFKSLIIDRELDSSEEHKYMMCAGNYNKDGWTFVFKANSIKEAEELISNNKFSSNKVYKKNNNIVYNDLISNTEKFNYNKVELFETDIVQIPSWM